MKASDALRRGRTFDRASALAEGLVWSLPALTFGWAAAVHFGLAAWWALVPMAGVVALRLALGPFDEVRAIERIEREAGTDGAFELALEAERGRDLPARSAAAVAARLAADLDLASVRRAGLAFRGRFALQALAAASLGLVALGVARNLAVEERLALRADVVFEGPAAPADLRATLEQRRAELEAQLAEARLAEAQRAAAPAEAAQPDPASEPEGGEADSAQALPEPETAGSSESGGAPLDEPADTASGTASSDGETAPSGANGANGVTPGPDGGRMVPPNASDRVPAWWPRRQRALVEAFFRSTT